MPLPSSHLAICRSPNEFFEERASRLQRLACTQLEPAAISTASLGSIGIQQSVPSLSKDERIVRAASLNVISVLHCFPVSVPVSN